MATTYTVAQVADRLDVSKATVRRFADEFADILPDYQHVSGTARSFTAADMRYLYVLVEEMERRPHGASRAALRQEIDAGQYQLSVPAELPATRSEPDPVEQPPARVERAELVHLVELLERLSEASERTEGIQTRQDALSARLDTLRGAQERSGERMDRLARDVDGLRRRVQRPWLYIVLSAAISALVVLAAVVLLLQLGVI